MTNPYGFNIKGAISEYLEYIEKKERELTVIYRESKYPHPYVKIPISTDWSINHNDQRAEGAIK